jgi:hypothetical protein
MEVRTRFCDSDRVELGPAFGQAYADLVICSKSNKIVKSKCQLGESFEDVFKTGSATFTGNRNFRVDDYEVYSIQ